MGYLTSGVVFPWYRYTFQSSISVGHRCKVAEVEGEDDVPGEIKPLSSTYHLVDLVCTPIFTPDGSYYRGQARLIGQSCHWDKEEWAIP